MVGIAFAIEDGPAHYLPFAHAGGGNLDRAHVVSYFRDQCRDFEGTIITSGGQYDHDYLWNDGIEFKRAKWHRDVQNAECLLDELQMDYSLDATLKRHGFEGKYEKELEAHAIEWGFHPKKELWKLHAGAAGRYAEGDVRDLPKVLRVQEKKIIEQKLERAYDNESYVQLALLRMTRRGVRIDLEHLERMSRWCLSVTAEMRAKIKHLTGVDVPSPMMKDALAAALKTQGIHVPRNPPTVKQAAANKPGNLSITKELLGQFSGNAVVDAITRWRKFDKIETTYVAGVRDHLIGDRLHPSFKQMRTAADDDEDDDEGARYGRSAARHPNVQAQPNRDPETGKEWRKIYIPEEGEMWIKGDYSQQEPRTTVHYAEVRGLRGAKEFGDLYRTDPNMDSHTMFAKLSGLKRGDAKETFLAICYGMASGTFATKMKLPTEIKHNRNGEPYLAAGPEAQALLDTLDQKVPFVRALARECSDTAKQRGYLFLIDGRRVRFPRDAFGNFDWTYKALNRLIQGSAAIQTKMALVALDREGYDPRLTVHDEFDFSMASMQRAKEAVQIMKDALPLRVPSRVDIEYGPNYGELEKYEEKAA